MNGVTLWIGAITLQVIGIFSKRPEFVSGGLVLMWIAFVVQHKDRQIDAAVKEKLEKFEAGKDGRCG